MSVLIGGGEAARILEVSTTAVRSFALDGRLRIAATVGRAVGEIRLFDRADVVALAAERAAARAAKQAARG